MNAKALRHKIDRFICSGEYDLLFRSWPGENLIDCTTRGHDALIEALVSEIRLRQEKVTFTDPSLEMGHDLTFFAHKKFAPMVRGLFPRREWTPVLVVLEKSVIFLTPNDIESVIRQARDLETAWQAANMYLTSISAKPLNSDAPCIVGFSVETMCYVSIEYFVDTNPYADYVMHEAAHIFHNTKRKMLGLPEIQHQEWLLPIDFMMRETFAYAIEAYSRIRELAKNPAERRVLFAELSSHPLPPTDFVEAEEYLDILKEAVGQRNGWKAILKRCTQQVTCSQRRPRKSKFDCD